MSQPRARESADRCPGVLRPHEAADGLLVRIRLVGGRLDARGLRTLAAVAEATGARIELTSRANLQLRALKTADLGEVAAALDSVGMLPPASHDRVRHVLADPLVGRRPESRMAAVDADVLLDRLADAIVADVGLSALSGRFLFAVDDGSGALDDAGADVVVRDTGEAAIAAAVAVARGVARAPGAWRAADLDGAGGRGRVPTRSRGNALAPPVGRMVQADGRYAVGALAPLGEVASSALDLLARTGDVIDVRVSRERGLVAVDLPDARAAASVEDAMGVGGLVLDPDSGWRGLSACAGTGACPQALADVRAIAAWRAAERAGPGRPRRREHWSACPRRCGETPATAVGVSARADGGWDRRDVAA